MEFENKKLRDVAEIARQIMMGEKVLHPNQQKLDVHEPEKDELTADDFKKLRAKKEEVKKEEVEELDEVKMADLPSRKVQGRAYGAYKPEPHAVDTLAGPKTKELKAIEAEKPIKKDPKNYVKDTGQKRNYKVHAGRYFSNLDTGVSSKGLEEPRYKNESFANILASYSEGGLKGLFETLNQNKVIVEEPDSEQFAQEVKTAQDKSEGKGKKAEVAAAGIEAVKQEGVEVVEYPLDANEINGYSEVTIGEEVKPTQLMSFKSRYKK